MALATWSKKDVGKISTAIKKKENHLKVLLDNVERDRNFEEITTCKKELTDLNIQDETHWRQRSKTLWLKEGDRNTKIFHQSPQESRIIE